MKQMTFNRWTLALATGGLISLTSAARADEKPSAVQTALSNTTISGYVSTSANVGLTGNYDSSPAATIPFQAGKENGFNLDVVKLVIARPEDTNTWSAGYEVDLLFGPDAVNYNTTAGAAKSDYAIKQAFITLSTPIGNGLDWKIGVFDSPLGYEVFDTGSNPNYTHSWGYYIEPTELTGLQATYKLNDEWSVNGGLANTSAPGINQRNTYPKDVWHKAYFGDLTYTAPSSCGWAAGSTVFAGILYGSVDTTFASPLPQSGNQVNYYGGLTLNTPWKPLTGGVAFDYAQNYSASGENVLVFGLYSTYKATDKLSFSARGEYVESDAGSVKAGSENLAELTGTVEYDLWANVQSRVEVRWDQDLSTSNGDLFAAGTERDSVGLYANIIYKF